MKKAVRALALVVAALAVSSFLLFYYRDNLSTHFPVKQVSAEAFRRGEIPFWNPFAGGGQPLAGNPNTLTFYPDNLLYLLVPAHVAFNLHFVLHLLLAYFAMRGLLLVRGVSHRAATWGAILYVSSGAVVSSAAFYNLVTAAALAPASLLLVELLLRSEKPRDALRCTAGLGAVWGLVILAGEPVMGAGIALLSAIAAATRLRAQVVIAMAIAVVIAAIVASPLLVAYGEIAGETERAGRTFSTQTVLAASAPPWRLTEVLFGPFFGLITDLSPAGFRSSAPPLPWQPLFASFFLGPLALAALVLGFRDRHWPYALAAVLLIVLALGRYNPLVVALVEQFDRLRILRYPEKLMLPATVALALLVAPLLDRELPSRGMRLALAFTTLLGIVAIAVYGRTSSFVLARAAFGVTAAAAATWFAWRSKARWSGSVAFVAIAPVVAWGVLTLPVDRVSPYREALRNADTLRARTIFVAPRPAPDVPTARELYRWHARSLTPTFASAADVRYVGDRSPEGMYSFLSRIVAERAARAVPAARMRWLRLLGCDTVLTPVGSATVEGSAPALRIASKVSAARSVNEAIERIESPEFDERNEVVAPSGIVAASGKAEIGRITSMGDMLHFRVRSANGAVVVTTETYFSAWTARTAAGELRTFPANVDRLGILVPPGDVEVSLLFGRRRTLVTLLAFVSLLVQITALTLCSRLRQRAEVP